MESHNKDFSLKDRERIKAGCLIASACCWFYALVIYLVEF